MVQRLEIDARIFLISAKVPAQESVQLKKNPNLSMLANKAKHLDGKIFTVLHVEYCVQPNRKNFPLVLLG